MKDGVHSLSMDAYLRDPAVNQSSLKRLARSPAHFRHYVDNPPPSTRPQIIGSVLHTAVLQPELLAGSYWIRPETYEAKGDIKKWNGNATPCRDWMAAHEDRPILRQSEHDSIMTMCMYVMQHPAAKLALGKGTSEQSLFASDPDSGVNIKCRTDRLSGNAVIELKTCEDASPAGFAKAVATYGYEVQAAYGLHIANLLGLAKTHWIFICVEKEPPFAVATYQLDEASIGIGRSRFQRLLSKYAECAAANTWPAFSNDILYLSLPEWSKKSETLACWADENPSVPALTVE